MNFYRSASGVLNSSGQLASDSASPSAASHLTRKDYVDGQITTVNSTITTLDAAVVKLAGTQTVTGTKTFSADLITSALNRNSRAAATDSAYETKVGAEANARWFVQADGKTWWGAGGATAVDVNLFRNAANVLRTNDALIVDGDLTVSGNLINTLQPKMQRGQESFVFSGVASVDVNVTFSPAFAAVPRIITSISMTGSLPSGSSALTVKAYNVSTTGMTLRVNDVGAINRTLTIPADWIALDQ